MKRIANTADSTAELEITADMIEAGVEVLSGFNREFEHLADGVARIYEAMALAKRGRHDRVPPHD